MSLKSSARAVIPSPLWSAARVVYRLPARVRDLARTLTNPLRPPAHMISQIGGSDFEETGREFLRHFVELGMLRPTDAVLDVGCGAGRMAIPLTGYLRPPGCYEGFDIASDEVAWCAKHITPRFPNFRFQVSDIQNTVYNPKGKMRAAEYRFPYPDASFDFVFLTSVFTHLVTHELTHYVEECSRVLRPGGRIFGTFFLLNQQSRAGMRDKVSTRDFRFPLDGCMTTDSNAPEAAVAYEEADIIALLKANGIASRQPFAYGSWSGRQDGVSYQDIVVGIRQ